MSDTYEVTFSRLGRGGPAGPYLMGASNVDELAETIHRRARTRLLSRAVEVAVELDEAGNFGEGSVFAGAQRVGEFTVKRVEVERPADDD